MTLPDDVITLKVYVMVNSFNYFSLVSDKSCFVCNGEES